VRDAGGRRRAHRLCLPCTDAVRSERYLEHQDAEADARRAVWKEWNRERQRAHRLKSKVQPAELASPETDPLDLGVAILDLLAG